MSDLDLQTRQRIELGYLRESMVRTQVERRINHREGDVSDAEIDEWEAAAYRRWRETYPALSQIFISIDPDVRDAEAVQS